MNEHTVFTEEALRSQDGKKVPLTDRPGGRVIGEATMQYDEGTGSLMAQMRVDDAKVAQSLGQEFTSVIFRKE